MSFHLLRLLMFILGLLFIGIGVLLFAVGAEMTVSLCLELIDRITQKSSFLITDMGTPNIDSELRFMAPFIAGYGVLVFLCAKHLRTHLYYVPHLMAVLLLGGLGRALSNYLVGEPHPLFIYLTGVEIGVPVVLYLLYARVVSKLR